VSSEAERQRALQLARETAGVTSVVDHMKMSSPNR
jgi:osmotically-inducible protein OsmY